MKPRLALLSTLLSLALIPCAVHSHPRAPHSDKPGQKVDSRKIHRQVNALRRIFVNQENRPVTETHAVTSSVPFAMVKEFIRWREREDPDSFALFVFTENYHLPEFPCDERVAGTMSNAAAFKAVMREVEGWLLDFHYENNDQDPRYLSAHKRVEDALQTLFAADAAVGYDGWEQNACAAPTPYILVLDPKAKKVYGMDLNPMNESKAFPHGF